MARSRGEIFLEDNLQSYFFENLSHLNASSQTELSQEIIFYSSQVLSTMAKTPNYFETLEDGKVREKMLGDKFLKLSNRTKEEQKSKLKDIGDTSLFLCGIFGENLANKIVDKSYYIKLGKTAYAKLDSLEPSLLDLEHFYLLISKEFEHIVDILALFASDFFKTPEAFYYLKCS